MLAEAMTFFQVIAKKKKHKNSRFIKYMKTNEATWVFVF